MKRKRIVVFVSAIVIVAVLFLLAFAVVGNPAVLINNHKLKEAIISVEAESVIFNEIVPFDWDFVYTFDPYLPKDEMEGILGFQSNSLRETVSEGMVQLVFVKDSTVVSSICGYGNSLGYAVSFVSEEENFSKIASTDNALFSVKKRDGIVRLSYVENNT
jgi:hypothetical protein